jgi:C4-dicarboxylate transporter, DctM subunit
MYLDIRFNNYHSAYRITTHRIFAKSGEEMTPLIVGIIGFVILFALLAIGLPVGVGMALIGFVGFAFLVSPEAALTKIANSTYLSISDYSFTVLPLFMLMAEVIFHTGLSKSLFTLASKWLGHLPGGIGIATIAACAVFAAISSSSIATAVTMGTVALPEMKKYSYNPKLAAGIVAAGGTLGILIPPSGVLIMYGIITQESIGTLFIAGIVPGIILAIIFGVSIYFRSLINPELCPRGSKSTLKEKFTAFGGSVEIIVLVILVLGGLMAGLFTPTEAGAVGAFGAIVISAVRRRLTLSGFKESLRTTAKTTGMIYTILIGAFILNYFVTVSTIPNRLALLVSQLPLPSFGIMIIIVLIYLGLGCFMDAPAMILLTVPIFFPMVVSMGYDPIWFGILIVLVAEMGMITPPVGMNVYAISGIAKDIPMGDIFRGVFPFFFCILAFSIILIFFPRIVMFLPELMK